MTIGPPLALGLALLNKAFGLGVLSQLAERVTFVPIPPRVLIFLVLGTIFLGIATHTEGGAMGAPVMAVARGRLNLKLMKKVDAKSVFDQLSCAPVAALSGRRRRCWPPRLPPPRRPVRAPGRTTRCAACSTR